MTGRIKLLRDGELLQPDADLPELGYDYDQPAEHDQACGTFGTQDFQLPHAECPEKFVCDVPADNAELTHFSNCVVSFSGGHVLSALPSKSLSNSILRTRCGRTP